MSVLLSSASILGLIAMLMSLTHLIPLTVSAIYEDGAMPAFELSMLLSLGIGFIVWLISRRYRRELKARDSMMIVTMIWIGGPLLATVPLLLTVPGLSFTDAYFETMSGLTTTGSTVLSNLDKLPPSVNVWRGLLQWLGGIGIVVMVVALLPFLGVGGRQIFMAETPGPMKDTSLAARVTETAKGLWGVYIIISLACLLAYKIAGMSWIDALMHMFTTVSTGGFSTHDASFGFFDSPVLEAIAILFMVVAAVNFGSHFMALHTLSAAPYRVDVEMGWALLVMLVSCAAISAYLALAGSYPDFLTALRHAAFNVVSLATSTGYATQDYSLWPIGAQLWMLLLVSVVSCSGSTGGGMKMVRAVVLCKQVHRELVRLSHPHAVRPMKLGRAVVENRIVFAILTFMFAYVAITVALTLVMVASGADALTAFSAVVACVNNLGPGLNDVGPATTFAALSDFQIWVLSAAMLVGRLEFFTVLVLLTPTFWRR